MAQTAYIAQGLTACLDNLWRGSQCGNASLQPRPIHMAGCISCKHMRDENVRRVNAFSWRPSSCIVILWQSLRLILAWTKSNKPRAAMLPLGCHMDALLN